MSTKILEPTPKINAQATPVGQVENGATKGSTATSPANGTHNSLPDLPTFPLEAGWRTVYEAALPSPGRG